ncbi:FHY3/FAR1 family [Parasponia andersonii]|uniref:FHY3/FAR1 family n=1 Tax=Parasponia andersonii TaxID=3476 RepID=A0A2P5ATH4_PARAD|nr:FHY3/FAR1 family [Parasponia andersonii]
MDRSQTAVEVLNSQDNANGDRMNKKMIDVVDGVHNRDADAGIVNSPKRDLVMQSTAEGTERIRTRVQRYNELCEWAIELSEEGSLSEETYNIAFRAPVEALKNCVNVNNSISTAAESSGNFLFICETEEENQESLATKTVKKKSTNRKRKDSLSSDGITLNGYYGAQQNVQGLLNLMEPPNDSYYVNPQSMQGLAQLDFRPQTSFGYSLHDDQRLRSAQLHGNASRHA